MSTTDYKIAVLGPKEVIAAFGAVGFSTYEVTNANAVLARLDKIKDITIDESNPVVYAVVCIIEDVLDNIDTEKYNQLTKDALPAVISLPGLAGSSGFAIQRLRSIAEQAVGSSII